MEEEQVRLAEELLFSEEEKPSFAKMLYFGIFDSKRVLPFPTTTGLEQERTKAFVDRLDTFAKQHIDADWIDRHANIPNGVIQGLAEIGMLGLTVPSEYGGLGFSQQGYAETISCLSGHCGSTTLFINVHQSIGMRALLIFGTEEQKNKWLPPLAKGERLAAFSLTEPNAGSDASAVETYAEYLPEQKAYRINGRKQWTTSGSIADMLTLMVQTEVDTPKGKRNQITAFIVSPDMPGFKILDPALEKVGMRGTRTSNLAFENMIVPEENILGKKGKGLRVCLTVLDYGRITFGAACTGSAKELLKRAQEHAITRHQFKRPLATFGLVKKKITMMSALVYAMDATTQLTAGLVDQGEEDVMLEAAILKVFTSDSLWTILYDSMQILGGRSFFTDQPFERMMRDARLNMIGEGSNEVLRAFIGAVGMRDVGMGLKDFMDQLKKPFTQLGEICAFGKRFLSQTKAPKIPLRANALASAGDKLGRAIRRFGFAVPRLLARHRENIVEQQLSLDRIATSAIAIYTITAVLSRLDRTLIRANFDESAVKDDLSVGLFYCTYAFDQIDENLGSLFNNHDDEIEKISDQLTGVHYP